MLSEGGPVGFGLSLALTNKHNPSHGEESEEALKREKEKELEKEVGILVNQIGKINQPPG